MKTLLRKFTPKTTLNKVNLALTGVFCVLLVGNIYLKSVNAAYGNPGCPEGEWPDCPPHGTAFFPHPNDVHWFFYCNNGVAYCHKCPAGTVYSPELENCIFQGVAKIMTDVEEKPFGNCPICGRPTSVTWTTVECEGIGNLQCTPQNGGVSVGCIH
ncbi:MAG: carbohydrate-binding module family 14 protein [Rikenellaceae bacterium]|nr:carbohydrate-binding module family 14 protein [Rikenellaceae bacterium]MCL2692621.1 carbohydrate-binding module family 14 protein [Rikenellaceae bacterium]